MLRKLCVGIALGLFGVALFLKLDKSVHRMTSGFGAEQLLEVDALSDLSFADDFPSPTLEEKHCLTQVLNQKFTLNDKNPYFYTVVSEDKNYEIKLFRKGLFRDRRWVSHIPLSINPYYRDRLQRKENKEHFFASCRNAFVSIKEEAGIIYSHLSLVELCPLKVSILDKKGKEYRLNLNQFAYCVRRRPDLLYTRLAEFIDGGDTQSAEKVVVSIVDLIRRLKSKGVVLDERTVCQQMGLVDGKAVHTEILCQYQDRNGQDIDSQDLSKWVAPLKVWLQGYYPQCISCLERAEGVNF